MNKRQFLLWFRVVSTISILFGLLYVVARLKVLPVLQHLLQWESAL
jgi:hypothetical protein